MAESNEENEAPVKKSSMMGKLMVWGVIFVLGAGTGAAVPFLTGAASGSVGSNGANSIPGRMDIPEPDDEIAFIEFEEIVVNINDPRYSRYMTCSFSIQVAKSQQPAIAKLVEERKVILMNWLIGHLRDKQLEDVRGKFGQNMLGREIHGKFNELLFTDGIERIQDVLFRDFKVQ